MHSQYLFPPRTALPCGREAHPKLSGEWLCQSLVPMCRLWPCGDDLLVSKAWEQSSRGTKEGYSESLLLGTLQATGL